MRLNGLASRVAFNTNIRSYNKLVKIVAQKIRKYRRFQAASYVWSLQEVSI
jgi:hypothetical protein